MPDKILHPYAVRTSFLVFAFFVATAVGAQNQNHSQKKQDPDPMAGMDMGNAQQGAGPEARAANEAMSGHDMNMGAHMFMTDLRPANAADEKRAAEEHGAEYG